MPGRTNRTRFCRLLLVAALLAPHASRAMEFTVRDGDLFGIGEIVPGDAARFKAFLTDRKIPAAPDAAVTLHLSADGGDATEGIALGRTLREAEIPAMVGHDAACADACALAFLGGTRAYATGVGTGRVLEFGGRLSFRGLLGPGAAQPMVETLIAYAREMRGIEPGALLEAAAALPPTSPRISRPRLLDALSIELLNVPAKLPNDWPVQACRHVVAKHLSALDDPAARIGADMKPIPSIRALRQALMAARQDEPPVARALQGLSDSDAIDLAVGGSFYLDARKPILDARSVPLERGAGFYRDLCVVVRSKDMLSVVLIDGVGHDAILKHFDGPAAFLATVDPDADLW